MVLLGAETYRDLYARFEFLLDELAGQCERFLAATEDLYVSAFDRLAGASACLGGGEAVGPASSLPSDRVGCGLHGGGDGAGA